MLKGELIKNIARELGLSDTTVYRALHHTGLVKTDTQNRIREYVKVNFPDFSLTETTMSTKVISVLTQRKPDYYWKTALDAMTAAIENYPSNILRLRTVFYSGLRSESELCDSLSYITRPYTDALIIVPTSCENCRNKIMELAEKIPVVVFNEYGDFGNVLFSAHGDGAAEGGEAAGLVAASSVRDKKVLLMKTSKYSQQISERIRGFCERAEIEKICEISGCIDLSPLLEGNYNVASTLPSRIARLIDSYTRDNPKIIYNCVYIADGLIDPVIIALKKIGRSDVLCFGHESAYSFNHSEIRGGYVRTDIVGQAKTAITVLSDWLLYGIAPEKNEYITKFDSYLVD